MDKTLDDDSKTPLADVVRMVEVEDGFQVWTRRIGGGSQQDRATLLVLHGGPGVPHNYLANLASLASERQPVVFYDQLGCGKSDCPDDPARWRMARFVEEIDRVRNALGLDRVVLLGQSWGGMLAIEYLLTGNRAVQGLVLANSTPSAKLWDVQAQRLRSELPPEIAQTLTEHEAAGTTGSEAYQQAMMAFYRRHVIRCWPMPDEVRHSFDHVGQPYAVMWGPSEFCVSGHLADWDRSADLHNINIPTLIISGQYDESTPAINQVLNQGIPGSNWVLMPDCSHLCHVERPECFKGLIQTFLDRLAS